MENVVDNAQTQEKNSTLQPPASGDGTTETTLLGSAADPWEAPGWEKLVPEKFIDEKGGIKIRDIAKSYAHLEKRIGSGELPPKDETGYKVDVKLPDGVEVSDENRKSFLKSCHAVGMTNKQVQFALDKYGEILNRFADSRDQTVAGLKKDWAEGYDENMGFAQKALDALVDEGDRAVLLKAGNNPALIRLLARLGKDLKEDTPPAGEYVSSGDDIESLQKSKAYWDPKDPEHGKVKTKVTAYYEQKQRKSA